MTAHIAVLRTIEICPTWDEVILPKIVRQNGYITELGYKQLENQ